MFIYDFTLDAPPNAKMVLLELFTLYQILVKYMFLTELSVA
ncbi:hypothetical protein [Bacillus mycoides]